MYFYYAIDSIGNFKTMGCDDQPHSPLFAHMGETLHNVSKKSLREELLNGLISRTQLY